MTVRIVKRGKWRRLHKTAMAHRPSGHGKGRWQNKRTYWASKMKDRRLRRISAESRRRNRG